MTEISSGITHSLTLSLTPPSVGKIYGCHAHYIYIYICTQTHTHTRTRHAHTYIYMHANSLSLTHAHTQNRGKRTHPTIASNPPQKKGGVEPGEDSGDDYGGAEVGGYWDGPCSESREHGHEEYTHTWCGAAVSASESKKKETERQGRDRADERADERKEGRRAWIWMYEWMYFIAREEHTLRATTVVPYAGTRARSTAVYKT